MIRKPARCSPVRFGRRGNSFERHGLNHPSIIYQKARGVAGAGLCVPALAADEKKEGKAELLFDGKSLNGWHKPPKRIGHENQWSLVGGKRHLAG